MNHFRENPSKFTHTNVHQVSSPLKKMGSHCFMTLVKTLPKPHPNNPSPSACLSDLFRHGIRNKASERPSGRKPREEAHSLEARKVLPIRIPYLMAVFKKTSKKAATFFFVYQLSNDSILFGWSDFCLPFEVFFCL